MNNSVALRTFIMLFHHQFYLILCGWEVMGEIDVEEIPRSNRNLRELKYLWEDFDFYWGWSIWIHVTISRLVLCFIEFVIKYKDLQINLNLYIMLMIVITNLKDYFCFIWDKIKFIMCSCVFVCLTHFNW